MGQRLTRNSRVTRVRIEDGQPVLDTRADTLTVEEPLQIRVDGQDLSTTMRTPGHDFELVHGFLHAEGVIHSREDVTTMRYCALSLIHISEPTRPCGTSRMPSSA